MTDGYTDYSVFPATEEPLRTGFEKLVYAHLDKAEFHVSRVYHNKSGYPSSVPLNVSNRYLDNVSDEIKVSFTISLPLWEDAVKEFFDVAMEAQHAQDRIALEAEKAELLKEHERFMNGFNMRQAEIEAKLNDLNK